MPHLQIQFDGTEAESWLIDASTEFPKAEFRVLVAQPRDNGLLAILQVLTADGEPLVRRLADTSEVGSYEVVYRDETMLLVRLTSSVTEPYEVYLESEILPQEPSILRNGRFSVELTDSHERLSVFIDELAAADIPYQILSLSQSYDSNELLTDHQEEFISAAVERGYYDTPRNCTLAELAASFDIHKSAASRLLRRAESRIITKFVAETAP
ncbi:helix-turn-helix domain-containing protein [Halococcus salsus]|uniref:helix-turn-helix domain-containing protein n=1 Tax=Halococcus salsus TaxID=2162894 RepID=UPI00135B27B3|nr:helix-turn-helix domain-containing protein [Halococcus salsus]